MIWYWMSIVPNIFERCPGESLTLPKLSQDGAARKPTVFCDERIETTCMNEMDRNLIRSKWVLTQVLYLGTGGAKFQEVFGIFWHLVSLRPGKLCRAVSCSAQMCQGWAGCAAKQRTPCEAPWWITMPLVSASGPVSQISATQLLMRIYENEM